MSYGTFANHPIRRKWREFKSVHSGQFSIPKSETYSELLTRAALPSLYQQQNIVILMYKVKNGLVPTYIIEILYNYPPKGRWIVVDIYRDAKRRGMYPPLFTDPEGDSCFSIYQIRWIRKYRFINGHNFFWNFRETTRHFSLRSQNSEYPRIFRVTGANQNARILLSTDLVNTNQYYPETVQSEKRWF